ncbi:MAG: segregation/condensation protein A [Gemmatimonadota bacterium]
MAANPPTTRAPEDLDDAFVVELDRFQGPLDLLLHLIREQDIDIFDIPIAQITQQFLRAMAGIERLGLDRAGEFLETAALLVRIKAQMLMPRRGDLEGALHDPRAELVRRLLEYEHFREASLRLQEAEVRQARHFRRGYVPPRTAPPPVTDLEVSWEELFAAALDLAERTRPLPDHAVAQRAVPIEEKIALIARTLGQLQRVEFRALVAPFGNKPHGVATLLAGLELAKRRQLAMRQRAPFTDLWLYRRKDEPVDEADAAG